MKFILLKYWTENKPSTTVHSFMDGRKEWTVAQGGALDGKRGELYPLFHLPLDFKGTESIACSIYWTGAPVLMHLIGFSVPTLKTGRKLIGLLLTLGVRSCSFESSLPDYLNRPRMLNYKGRRKLHLQLDLINSAVSL